MTPQKKSNPSLSDLVGKKNEETAPVSETNVVMDKTPAELSQETPDETASRYNIKETAHDDVVENPRVEVSYDDYVKQVPSSTHLHPDIAKDPHNRGISAPTTDIGQVVRGGVVEFDHAPDVNSSEDKNTIK